MSKLKCTKRAEDLSAGNLPPLSCRGLRVENWGSTDTITKFWRSWIVSYPVPSTTACQPLWGEQLSGSDSAMLLGAESTSTQVHPVNWLHTVVSTLQCLVGSAFFRPHVFKCAASHAPLHYHKDIWGHLSPDVSAPYTSCQPPIHSSEFSALHSLCKHIACYWLPLLLTGHVILQPGLRIVFSLPDSATSSCQSPARKGETVVWSMFLEVKVKGHCMHAS